jgi:uncharacterized protein YprB with RNaseH-like and TPR domain
MEVFVWDKGEQYVGLDQIKTDWSVAAWGAKWLNDPVSKVLYRDTQCNKDVRYDKNILLPMRELLDEADIVLTQNGKNFDAKKLNARFMELGINPPSPYSHIDTYKEISKIADFTSSSLDYLTHKLNKKYTKLSHKLFPGLSLWKECLKGNKKAWEEMKRYNIHDVLSTEELYLNTRQWYSENAPKPFAEPSTNKDCTTCGAKGSVFGNGTRLIKTKRYQRLCCNKCGSHTKGDIIK